MPWPPVTLRGEHVELVPRSVEAHGDALFDCTPPETLELFLTWPEPWTREAFKEWLVPKGAAAGWLLFTVIERATGRVVGSTGFLDIDEQNRSVEIGSTWYAPEVRGTSVNPECKLLMLRHAIEVMGCARVTLKTDARNIRSQRAMAGIGAVREGTLRRHRVQQNGFVRDTVYFGVTAEDWPRVRALLEARLAAPPAAPAFTVRPATPADVAPTLPLVKLICDQHEAMDSERFTFRPDLMSLYERWLPERITDPRSVYLVAEAAGGEIVGHIVGTIEPEVPIYWTPESAWIHDLVVTPRWRGRGVGKALTTEAARRFGAMGAARIRLETAAVNDAARAMFAACGFRPSTREMLMTLVPPPRTKGPT